MKNWFQSLENSGITPQTPASIARRMRIGNRIYIYGSTAFLVFGTTGLFQLGFNSQAIATYLSAFILSMHLVATRLLAPRGINYTWVGFSANIYVATYFFVLSFGAPDFSTGLTFYFNFVLLSSLPFATFDPRYKKLSLVVVGVCLSYLTIYVNNPHLLPAIIVTPPELGEVFSRMAPYSIIIIVTLLMYGITNIGDQYESQLVQSMAQLEGKNKDLAAAQHDLQEALHEVQAHEEELLQNTDELHAVNEHLMSVQTELEQRLKDLNAAQEQLVQSEKMASLGQLVAGVAHEINTPVGIAVTAASHLDLATQQFEARVNDGQLRKSDLQQFVIEARESSRLVLSNLERAAQLVQSFKKVAVDQTSESHVSYDLMENLRQIMVSLQPTLKTTALKVDIKGPEVLEVTGQPSAISQIIINFVTNSLRYAYEQGQAGKLSLEANIQNGRVKLRYSDDGKGIDPANLTRIFDPFFTTGRNVGGSGLGLNIVYNLVTQKLGGEIKVESTLGQGTTFILDFPASH